MGTRHTSGAHINVQTNIHTHKVEMNSSCFKKPLAERTWEGKQNWVAAPHAWNCQRRIKCYQLAHVSDMIKWHLISGLWALPHPYWNADWLEHVWVLCRQSQLLGLLEAPWFSDTRSTFKTAQKNTQSCVSSSPSPGKRLETTEAVAGNWVGPDNTLANCSPWS